MTYKIQIDQDNVSLKRTISPDCKSEYQLNSKIVTKHELDNLLDCAGLSRTNPYFIIQQGSINFNVTSFYPLIGKISKIAQMNEEELYSVLQEIIGIKQYETKKNDAVKFLTETSKIIIKFYNLS